MRVLRAREMGKAVVAAVMAGATAVCTVAALVVRRRIQSVVRWARAVEIVKELEERCATPIGLLKQVANAMAMEMQAGLASEGDSKLKMLISYVDNLPSGYERPTYYSSFYLFR